MTTVPAWNREHTFVCCSVRYTVNGIGEKRVKELHP